MARTTTADVLVDGLARAGAARVFAAPDAPATLRVAAERRPLDLVEAPDALTAAVLAAVSGEIGEVPGAMFAGLGDARGLVCGLAHAARDRAPLVVVTGDGADAGLVAPVVKGRLIVEAASAGRWIADAANLAMKDPRGPVHLVVGSGVADEPALPVASSCRPAPLPPPAADSLEAFGAALVAASRPLIIAGLECGADDARWIRSFAEALPAPVLATAKGKGALADPHPLALGALGPGQAALARADLVILLGVDAGELPPTALPAGVRVARLGRAEWAGGDLVADARGDLALVIEELAPRVRARPAADWDVAELDRLKRAVIRAATAAPAGRLVALLREAMPAETLATADVPALAAWQAVRPREALSPLGLATPGYAVVAAVAAQLAHADRRVVALTSAHGLSAGQATLRRAAALALPLIVVTLDALDSATAARLDSGGVEVLAGRGEAGFTLNVSRALGSGRLTVVAGAGGDR